MNPTALKHRAPVSTFESTPNVRGRSARALYGSLAARSPSARSVNDAAAITMNTAGSSVESCSVIAKNWIAPSIWPHSGVRPISGVVR